MASASMKPPHQQAKSRWSTEFRGHLLVAAAIAFVAAVLLLGLVYLIGVRGSALWVIAGHQLVANTLLLAWLNDTSGDESMEE